MTPLDRITTLCRIYARPHVAPILVEHMKNDYAADLFVHYHVAMQDGSVVFVETEVTPGVWDLWRVEAYDVGLEFLMLGACKVSSAEADREIAENAGQRSD